MNIGDLFLGLKVDQNGELKTSVTKAAAEAGDAGGKTLSEHLSSKLKGIGSSVASGIRGSETEILRAVRGLDKGLKTDFESVFAGAFFAADLASPFADQISSAFDKVTSNPKVQAAGEKLGDTFASVTGNTAAMSIGSGVAGVAIALAFDQLAANLKPQIAQMSDEEAKQFSGSFGASLLTNMDAFFNANPLFKDLFGKNFADDLDLLAFENGRGAGLKLAEGATDAFEHDSRGGFQAAAYQAAVTMGDTLGDHDSRSPLIAGSTAAAQAAADAFSAKQIWDHSAQVITGDLASALRDTSAIDGAMKNVEYAITHPMAIIAKEATIEADIARINYYESLDGTTAEQKTIFEQSKATLEAQWQILTGTAFDEGAHTAKAWFNGYVQTWQGNKVNLPGYQGSAGEPAPGHGIQHRAAGGPGLVGHLYRINELGEEYFQPAVNGTFLPHNTAAGDNSVTFNIYDATDPQKVGQVVLDKLQRVFSTAHSLSLDTSGRPIG